MNYRRKWIIWLLVAGILLPPLRGWTQKQPPALREDIDVMETILTKLFKDSDLIWRGSEAVQGVYLNNFGLLFTVKAETSRLLQLILSRNLRRMTEENLQRLKELSAFRSKSQEKKLRELTEKNLQQVEIQLQKAARARKAATGETGTINLTVSSSAEMSDEDLQQWLAKVDRKVFTFLETYADRGNRLKSNERLAVVVFLGNVEDLPKARLYQVKKRHILDFRHGRLTELAFRKKVDVTDVNGAHAEAIDILAEVLTTSLQKLSGRSGISTGEANGFYLKDLGVLFQLSNMRAPWFPVMGYKTRQDYRAFIIAMQKADKDTSTAAKEMALQRLTNRLIEVLGTYGPTLHFLPKNQSLFVLYSVGGSWGRTNLLLRLKKSDVLAYSRGTISLKELRRRAQIVQY